MDMQSMIEQLKTGICLLTFLKKSGERTTRRATLAAEYLPLGYDNASNHNEKQLPFWDCDAGGWRSAIAENVISITAE